MTLPIGHRQTISQPYIVASMTELVDPQPGDTVLEIGTGSGYQAAVLARLRWLWMSSSAGLATPVASPSTARTM